MSGTKTSSTPELLDQFGNEPDYSDPSSDDFEALSRDQVPVRSMEQSDLDAICRVDRRITGADRRAYYKRMVDEALKESGVRISVVAEQQGELAGFLMARVGYGEFGQTATDAVIDTIGVDPAYAGQRVGEALMSQLLLNLASLRVEKVRTQVAWSDFRLLGFLEHCGFRPGQRLALTRRLED